MVEKLSSELHTCTLRASVHTHTHTQNKCDFKKGLYNMNVLSLHIGVSIEWSSKP